MSIAELPRKKKKGKSSVAEHERSPHDEIKLPAMPVHLREALKAYRQPHLGKAIWQMVNTLVPYAALWVAAWKAYDVNPWLSLPFALAIGLIMLRIFVLHHDCTHGSFFKSRAANELWGFLMGALVLTPFHRWRRSHNYHHAHSGDLDHRGEGYITMHTVKEYQALTSWQKFLYRQYRSAWFMFGVGPYIQFLILERFTFDLPKTAHVARWGVWKTNALLALIVGSVFLLGGWPAMLKFVAIAAPACLVSTVCGVWLFFVQHNYDQAYFKRHKDWNFSLAALEGSSFYDLPGWLHWISGNIGYHHIHHLDSLVPNYNLARCHNENPEFQTPYRITLWSSFRCYGLDLWDEDQQRLVPFSAANAS